VDPRKNTKLEISFFSGSKVLKGKQPIEIAFLKVAKFQYFTPLLGVGGKKNIENFLLKN
jgi:hypothetical protein